MVQIPSLFPRFLTHDDFKTIFFEFPVAVGVAVLEFWGHFPLGVVSLLSLDMDVAVNLRSLVVLTTKLCSWVCPSRGPQLVLPEVPLNFPELPTRPVPIRQVFVDFSVQS